MRYFHKIKSFWELMICFCYFCLKKFFPVRTWPIMSHFFANWTKKTIFKRFYQLFFRTAGLQYKLLILIESPNIFHWKSAKKVKWVWSFGQTLGQIKSNVMKKQRNWNINGDFSYFEWGIHLQARRSGYRNTWVEIEG